MELNSKVLNALKPLSGAASDESKFSVNDKDYLFLIDYAFKSFVINSKSNKFELKFLENEIEYGSLKNSAELKNTIAALYTLIGESVRNAYDSNSLSTFLEDNRFTAERVDIFKKHYERMYPVIRLYLSSVGFSFPHVIDVKWRLDNHIKEDSLEKINEPIYLIDLKVEKPSQEAVDTIQFACTVEQLQDLVYKLKEATKSIEKMTQY